jgi:hypothetical protein
MNGPEDALAAPSQVIAAPQSDAHGELTATALKRLSVSETVMELDRTGAPVLVFRHAGHGRINQVYRRPDGHIGWIDPPAMNVVGGH